MLPRRHLTSAQARLALIRDGFRVIRFIIYSSGMKGVEFVLNEMILSSGKSILDMGCGPGRHAIELARCRYRVTGVDLIQGMLVEARKAARETAASIDFIHSDSARYGREDSKSLSPGTKCLNGKRPFGHLPIKVSTIAISQSRFRLGWHPRAVYRGGVGLACECPIRISRRFLRQAWRSMISRHILVDFASVQIY
jgi:SAM-dependent methyltransferase